MDDTFKTPPSAVGREEAPCRAGQRTAYRLSLLGLLTILALVAAACSNDTGGQTPLRASGTKSSRSRDKVATEQTTPVADPDGTLRPFDGQDFYAPPDPLPTGPHGTLIRYQPMATPSFGSAKAYRMMYLSRSVPGQAIAVTGTALVPDVEAPAGGRKVLTLSHGTTGIADQCAPSKDPGGELNLVAPLLDKGFLVAETDYEGLGTPGRHPYLVGVSEGRSVLDAVLAAGSLPDAHAGERVAIAGYSQGGHGALWADQLARSWTPDLEVVGTFAGAPASEIDVILKAAPQLPIAGFAYMIIAGIAAAYPDADPATFLTPTGLTKLDLVDEGCAGEVVRAFAGSQPSDLIRADGPSSQPWARIAIEDNPGGAKTPGPTLVIHSQADDLVPIVFSEILQKRMCDSGQVVERRVLMDGQGHGPAAVPAYQQALPWLEARFDPNAPGPKSTCPAP